MEICLLGSLEVRDDDGKLVPLSPHLQTLLIALALRCGEVVTDDHLIDAIWADALPRSVNALQRHVSALRARLVTPDVVQRRGAGYVLTLDRSAIDIFRFETLTARGHEAMRSGDLEGARALLDQALSVWRGDALADVAYHEFAQVEIARLHEARLIATEARVDAELALGRDTELIGELEQLVAAHPLREHLRAQLMLALARSGRQADALRAYQSARAILGEELGLEPSQELRAIEAAIFQQDDAVVRRDGAVAAAGTRTNLRTPLTTLIGRGYDLDALRPLLHAHRLVTLVGPGGVGKSRLAIEAAREWLEAEATDVWLVELADVTDPDEVVPAIMSALELPRTSTASGDVRRLNEFLEGRGSLLVLDNCEHLLASVARIAQDLLESCAILRIWTTSREGLAIPGETLSAVPPLSLDDAVALFIERGQAADPMSDLDDSVRAAGTLVDVCTRLDGLPLAIELAAARLRAMPIAEIAAGLEDRFRLLNRGARTALPRQQTMRAVVDWSYDLLFEDERRVFERLSVFSGGCAAAAARAVCADADISEDDVAELVTRLADKSLISVERDEFDPHMRFRMLQTLVDYGRERLQHSGDAPRVYAAHVRYYTDFAVRSVAALEGDKQRGWLRAVTANLANLRSALDESVRDGDAETAQTIAGCLGWYWWFTGRALEGSQWLTLARNCPGPVRELTGARVMAWTAFTRAPGFVRWAEPDESAPSRKPRGRRLLLDDEIDALGAGAFAAFREAGALAELAGVETALAVSYSTRGNHLRAAELLAEADHLLGSVPVTARVDAMHAFVVARLAFVEDRYTVAEEAFRVCIEHLDAIGADVHCSFALRYAGRLAALRGDRTSSIAAIERALDLARALGLSGFVNVLLTDLGESLVASGDVERAREVLQHPLTAARDAGFRPGIAESLFALAVVEWEADDADRAARLAQEALDIALDVQDLEVAAHCLGLLGFVAERRGDLDRAHAKHTHALELACAADEPRRTAFALDGLACVALADNDGGSAARLLGAASAFWRAPGRARGWAFAAGAHVIAEQALARAETVTGRQAASKAFSAGAADPEAVVTEALAKVAG